MSKLETLKFILWKRSGLHLHDALARYYLYLSNEEIKLYENELDQKSPETEFQSWISSLFEKLHHLIKNSPVPESDYIEYGFQKIGQNFSYPVSEKLK